MINRRKFIKGTTLAALSSGFVLDAFSRNRKKVKKPVVISTWNFGREANAAAWEVLKTGGSALDAVEQGVHVPEADPQNQSVGYGGLPDREGRVTLDACIMDEHGNAGSVAALQHIMHPISVARKVMEKTPHVMLVGEGALQFALSQGFKKENLLTPEAEKAWKEWLKTSKYEPIMNIENKVPEKMPGGEYNHDTIGMIALDEKGNMSGACTTSGMAYKMHGRVGDSPIIGAGMYVDNAIGGAAATGVGEEVIKVVGSFLVVELMRQGRSPQQACQEAVERIAKRDPKKAKEVQVGFIALNKQGEYGAYCLQPGFSYAVKSQDEELVINGKSLF